MRADCVDWHASSGTMARWRFNGAGLGRRGLKGPLPDRWKCDKRRQAAGSATAACFGMCASAGPTEGGFDRRMSSSCRIPSDKGPTLAEMSGYAVRNVFNKTGFPEKSGQCDEFRMMPREWRQTGTGKKTPMPPISACVVVCLVLAGGFGSLGQAVAFDGKPAADDAQRS